MNVALEVGNLDASLRFYGEAMGFSFRELPDSEPGAPHPGVRRIAFDKRGLPRLELRTAQGKSSSGIEVGFGVFGLAQAHQRAVKAGATVLHPPRRERFGLTARYQDPDGNVVALCEFERPLWPMMKTTLLWGLAVLSAAALWFAFEVSRWING